jgi:hypothetical protein
MSFMKSGGSALVSIGQHSVVAGAAAVLVWGVFVGCASTSKGAGEGTSDLGSSPPPSQLGALDTVRPANVPSDYRLTPNGYFHPSCILEVAEGERVVGNTIQRADGSSRVLPSCGHDFFDRLGKPNAVAGTQRLLGEDPPPVEEKDGSAEPGGGTFSGWVVDVEFESLRALGGLSATWNVPDLPKVAAGQTVYYFPGLQTSGAAKTILQPVLAYRAGRGEQWTIESWNCCQDGYTWHSTPVPVNPRDTIRGTISSTGCDARTGVCADWVIRTEDLTIGQSTTLNTSSYGARATLAVSGALEVYDVPHCAGLPADGVVSFTNVTVRDVSGATIVPSWSRIVAAPLCGLGATSGPTSATITNTPVVQSTPPLPRQCGRIEAGEGLTLNGHSSCDRRFTLTMRSNGELTLDKVMAPKARLWTSRVTTEDAFVAMMQSDGDFVIKDIAGATVWSAGTAGHPGASLLIDNDGNMMIHDTNGVELWATGTGGH